MTFDFVCQKIFINLHAVKHIFYKLVLFNSLHNPDF